MARPIAAGVKRLSFGPSFTMAWITYSRSVSTERPSRRAASSAFATALLSTFSTSTAACFFEKCSSASASFTLLPRI